jgi:NAD(P)-dependent dehydrogenase (short-subunit alcohol dehydrogenase family)
MSTTQLEDRVVLVTGAAGGIGAAVAAEVARQGADVALLDVDPGVAAVAERIRSLGGASFAAVCDLRDEASVRSGVEGAADALGGLDGVVNNAGVNAYGDAVAMTLDEWDETFAIDLRGAWLVLKYALPHLVRRPSSSVVNISSIHAKLTVPGMYPYAGAKAGLEGITRSLALDYGPRNVRVNAVAPGFTRTRLVEEWLEHQDDPERARREVLERTALGRMAEPEDIAAVVAFLLGEGARAITGATVAADCGLGVRF